ncbi:hypothetical protein EV184_1127 [Sinorhizobium americanum]|uniref:Uncharacterized protein n=1 Tax=Sinorhizobium americanum TaxID=194963 RepID=A0A4R2BN78_9HYPH|nr:hypothetical protein EV184_1127 [Sinorhizobium americanum]
MRQAFFCLRPALGKSRYQTPGGPEICLSALIPIRRRCWSGRHRSLEFLQQNIPLKFGQPFLFEQTLDLLRRTSPGGPMSRLDAGIGTQGWLAKRGQRTFGFGGLLQACGRAGIEEAIGQHPDMQCSREADGRSRSAGRCTGTAGTSVEDGGAVASAGGSCRPDKRNGPRRACHLPGFRFPVGCVSDTKTAGSAREPAVFAFVEGRGRSPAGKA